MARNEKIDILKGILIFLVVCGHATDGVLHDIIFLFHMPLFFVVSGYVLKNPSISSVKRTAVRLLVPYMLYGIFNQLLNGNFAKNMIRLIYGGRFVGGVYWYTTCFIFTLVLFTFLSSHFQENTCKLLILIGGGGSAVLESNVISGSLGIFLSETIHLSKWIDLLKAPGIPWNLDVALLACVYLAIGYYNKEKITQWINNNDNRYDITASVMVVLLLVFCYFNYRTGKACYYFDMKHVYYRELLSAVAIPCAFGFVFVRIIHALVMCKAIKYLTRILAFMGRNTIPIMFLHIPLNSILKNLEESLLCGGVMYVLIGTCAPIIFTVILGRFELMSKLFGLNSSRKGNTINE